MKMKSKLRSVLALLLTLSMALSLTACNNAADSNDVAPEDSSPFEEMETPVVNIPIPQEEEAEEEPVPAGYERIYLISKYTSLNDDGTINYYSEYTFDDKGNIIEQNDYDGEGNYISGALTEFNENSKITLYQIFDENKQIIEWTEYGWDEEGRMILNVEYDGNGAVTSRYTCEYDKNGNMLNSATYGENDQLEGREEATYNEDGTTNTYLSYDGEENVIYRDAYTYNEQGKLIKEEISYESDGEAYNSVSEYEYDSKGNQTLLLSYDDGVLAEKVESAYDDRGNMLVSKSYEGSAKKPYEVIEREYDSENRQTKSTIYGEDGKVNSISEYVFDEKGNQLQYSVKDGENVETYRMENTFNENGDPLTNDEYGDGGLLWRTVYEYDDKGSCVSIKEYNEEKLEVSRSEYTYDSHGNQIAYIVYDAEGNIAAESSLSEWTSIVLPEGTYIPDERGDLITDDGEWDDLDDMEELGFSIDD